MKEMRSHSILIELVLNYFAILCSAYCRMSFGSRTERKRQRDDKSVKVAAQKRLREEEDARLKQLQAKEDEWQRQIAENMKLVPEARMVKAVKMALEEQSKAKAVRIADKDIIVLYSVTRSLFYQAKALAVSKQGDIERSNFYAPAPDPVVRTHLGIVPGGYAEGAHETRVRFAVQEPQGNGAEAEPQAESQTDREIRLSAVLTASKESVKVAQERLLKCQQELSANFAQVKQKTKLKQDVQNATNALFAERGKQTAALHALCEACINEEGPDSAVAASIPAPRGRPATFTEETFAACIAEFKKQQLGIKDGIAQDYLVKMLLDKRQELQAASGQILQMPSKSCMADAVRRLDTETAPGTSQPDSRARALEDYRNSIICTAMWHYLNGLKICPALQFSLDEVGVWLNARDGKPTILHFQKGTLAEAVRRGLSPSGKQSKRQPRMVYMNCMTNAEGDLSAAVAVVKDRQCQKDKVIIKPVDGNLWTCFVHPDFKKEALQRILLKSVFLRVIIAKQKLVAAQLSKEDGCDVEIPDTQNLSQGDPTASCAFVEGETRPRAILTFDGANETIETLMHSALGEKCSALNIALFKCAPPHPFI